MNHAINTPRPCQRLRYRRQGQKTSRTHIPDADAAKLLHELQLHQLELEAQNDELQRAKAESQAALERYTEFYDDAPVGYFTLDRAGRIAQTNLAGAALLGSERDRLPQKRFVLFVERQERSLFHDFLSRVFAGSGKESCTLHLRRHAAGEAGVFVHLEAVRRAPGHNCSVVAIDLSERKRAERLQAQYREELEATVAERTSELLAANQDLEGFVYAASHDMKAPLARLGSLSDLLSQRARTRLEGDDLVLLDLIQQNALRLNALVEDLLVHAQIRQQPPSFRPTDVAALTRTVLNELADQIRQRRALVRLDFPAGMSVQCDPFNLRQALHNLVENALKYSARGMAPEIEIGGRLEHGKCRMWVRDEGIGIDKLFHDRIFEIFRRLHTYSEYPGNGVGLALVKKAIERMGGKVAVDSEPGRGATFHLEWPQPAAKP